MGTPWMGFMEDEFKWKRNKSAISFGILVLIVGLPTVFFFEKGVFDEYDYWAGTVSLVVFALAECIIFAWIYGIDKGWAELNEGADVRAHNFFKPIVKYVTPLLLLFVFVGALFTPKGNDWQRALNEGWELDPSSIIGKITNKGIVANRTYFADYYESETNGIVHSIRVDEHKKEQTIEIADQLSYYRDSVTNKVKRIPENMQAAAFSNSFDSLTVIKTYSFGNDHQIIVKEGDKVKTGEKITNGPRINDIFYIDMARLLLVALFVFLGVLVYIASQRRKQIGRDDL
jgi:neurotransmitter:Na+ symporter, NSS family